MTVRAIHGDSREVLKTLADASIDACVCDPPYALVSIGKRFGKDGAAPATVGKTGAYARASAGFMGQKWDNGETAFDPDFWREVYRVLKPGAHVVAASGTRTYHRLACAVEDAGFEIRDMVSWLYGSGFPKSHDVSKGIDKTLGRAGRTDPTGSPVKRMIPGADQNKAGWDKTNGREYQPGEYRPATPDGERWEGWGTALKPACEPWVLARKPLVGTVAANVLTHGTGALNIDGCRVGPDVDTRRAKGAGEGAFPHSDDGWRSHAEQGGRADLGRWPANVCHDGSAEVVEAFPDADGQQRATGPEFSGRRNNIFGDDSRDRKAFEPRDGGGSASRFFYTAKADAEDRLGSRHPTVKPISLMRWLCRLVCPPGGLILDPFAGTGTTGLAAMGEGFDAILIEREAEYFADIERRLAWARGDGRLTAQEMARPSAQPADLGLFAETGDAA